MMKNYDWDGVPREDRPCVNGAASWLSILIKIHISAGVVSLFVIAILLALGVIKP